MDNRNKLFFFLGGAGILSALLFFAFQSRKLDIAPLKHAELMPEQSASSSPLPPSAPVAVGSPTPSQEDLARLQTLDEIVKSKYDNDPRLDQDFRHLSSSMKQALYRRYQAFPREDRNGRGLVVFLVSRELNSVEDIRFLQSVYEEPPCTNMDGCSAAPSNDPHHSGVENTSLNYPQLVGLYQIEKVLKENPKLLGNAEMYAALQDLLSKAKAFPVLSVQNRAATILALLSKH